MIKLGELCWSNVFSYGSNNKLDLSGNKLTQLIGKNGYGKTSIALILEEVLFNKNSKGIKKGSILNRYADATHYTIELSFTKDGQEYKISTKRGSTQTVKLLKNGVDISSHTSTATYKQIEEILGIDHKAFTQIVNQSSSSSLEFLTATDTNRKKFLIDLLDLSAYITTGEHFKVKAKELDVKIAATSSNLSMVNTWIDKNAGIDLSLKPLVPIPEQLVNEPAKIAELRHNLATLSSQNKRIIQNNTYKSLMDAIDVRPVGPAPVDIRPSIVATKAQYSGTLASNQAIITKFAKLGDCCPTCDSKLDPIKISEIVTTARNAHYAAKEFIDGLDLEIAAQNKLFADWNKAKADNEKYEQYHSLYDPTLATEILDEAAIKAEIVQLESKVTKRTAEIDSARKINMVAEGHNSRVAVIKEQIEQFESDKAALEAKLADLKFQKGDLELLVKTFSTSGLVAYKIECLIKDLEELVNNYLTDLSDGRFQLTFQVSGSDKLNVVITDNGRDVDIVELSNGERARVNLAALLGIRKLLQITSNSRINLLFLDEVIENLDLNGKEKLIEVLLGEEHLDTILVSHGFEHPLLEKVQVVKENNISRIE